MECNRHHRLILAAASAAFLSFLSLGIAFAQDAPAQEAAPTVKDQAEPTDIDRILQDEQLRIGLQESFQRKIKLRQPDVDLTRLGTMFFTVWQHALLQEAKARFLTRAPDASELASQGDESGQAIKGPREIRLGGISYSGPRSWTVWLNGGRITPDAIPREVIDIKVAGDFIELKWFDAYTNLIFPVRLRPHQRFNLDNRIFLPGEGLPQ